MKVIDPRKPPYRATPGGAVDATEAIQRALDDVGIGAVYIGVPFKVTTLRPRLGVRIVGDGWDPNNPRRGSVLLGTPGHNVVELPSKPGDPFGEIGFKGVGFDGGQNQIVSSRLCSFLYLEHVLFVRPAEAAVAIVAGSAEEWYFRDVLATGGKYFFRMHNVLSADKSNYLDKALFENVVAGNQSENAWRIEAALSNNVTWSHCTINFSGKHAFYAGGGLRGWLFQGGNTEQCGTTGKGNRATGSIFAGSNRLGLNDASGFAAGDVVTIAGAGAPLKGGGRKDFSSLVRSVSGAVLMLDGPAPSTVTKADVTNAIWDEFVLTSLNGNSSPGYITWVGGQWGQQGGRGGLRYAMNLERMAGYATLVGCQIGHDIPVYDPNYVATVVGAPVPRRPA